MGKLLLKVSTLLLLCTALYSTVGCDTVTSVKEWLVEIATSTGEIIQEKAEYLYTAVRNAFFRYKTEDGVRYDRDNPLKGLCVEDRTLHIVREDVGIDITFNLKGKPMKRDSEVSPWMVDRDALPRDVQKFWDLGTI
ncbi:MAG: hypothetical protein IJG38_12425 [Thermoguttaceae bacterium]|nr:hypothetical protein [Thermoguttaceae bacterium]MBQ6615123.1 hypothetical protein [Thermoguttaceae bacterium]